MLKTVETKLSSEHIVKVEKQSDGTWLIGQQKIISDGDSVRVEKNADGTWNVERYYGYTDITDTLDKKEKALYGIMAGGSVIKVLRSREPGREVYRILVSGNSGPGYGRGCRRYDYPKGPYRPPTSGGLVGYPSFHRSSTRWVTYEPEGIFHFKAGRLPIIPSEIITTKLPAGEIVDIKKMSDGTWVIIQNVEEEQS